MIRPLLLTAALCGLARTLQAQALTRADSNLVYAILTAEDRRDSLAPALVEGMRHAESGQEKSHEPTRERRTALLLVRCWVEPSRGAEPKLRGCIRDLRSGTEVPFSDLSAVEAQLRRQLGCTGTTEQQEQQQTMQEKSA